MDDKDPPEHPRPRRGPMTPPLPAPESDPEGPEDSTSSASSRRRSAYRHGGLVRCRSTSISSSSECSSPSRRGDNDMRRLLHAGWMPSPVDDANAVAPPMPSARPPTGPPDYGAPYYDPPHEAPRLGTPPVEAPPRVASPLHRAPTAAPNEDVGELPREPLPAPGPRVPDVLTYCGNWKKENPENGSYWAFSTDRPSSRHRRGGGEDMAPPPQPYGPEPRRPRMAYFNRAHFGEFFGHHSHYYAPRPFHGPRPVFHPGPHPGPHSGPHPGPHPGPRPSLLPRPHPGHLLRTHPGHRLDRRPGPSHLVRPPGPYNFPPEFHHLPSWGGPLPPQPHPYEWDHYDPGARGLLEHPEESRLGPTPAHGDRAYPPPGWAPPPLLPQLGPPHAPHRDGEERQPGQVHSFHRPSSAPHYGYHPLSAPRDLDRPPTAPLDGGGLDGGGPAAPHDLDRPASSPHEHPVRHGGLEHVARLPSPGPGDPPRQGPEHARFAPHAPGERAAASPPLWRPPGLEEENEEPPHLSPITAAVPAHSEGSSAEPPELSPHFLKLEPAGGASVVSPPTPTPQPTLQYLDVAPPPQHAPPQHAAALGEPPAQHPQAQRHPPAQHPQAQRHPPAQHPQAPEHPPAQHGAPKRRAPPAPRQPKQGRSRNKVRKLRHQHGLPPPMYYGTVDFTADDDFEWFGEHPRIGRPSDEARSLRDARDTNHNVTWKGAAAGGPRGPEPDTLLHWPSKPDHHRRQREDLGRDVDLPRQDPAFDFGAAGEVRVILSRKAPAPPAEADLRESLLRKQGKDEDLREALSKQDEDLRKTLHRKHADDDLRDTLLARNKGADLRQSLSRKVEDVDLRSILFPFKSHGEASIEEDLRSQLERKRSPSKPVRPPGGRQASPPVPGRPTKPPALSSEQQDLRGELDRRRETAPEQVPEPLFSDVSSNEEDFPKSVAVTPLPSPRASLKSFPEPYSEPLDHVASALKVCLDDYDAMESSSRTRTYTIKDSSVEAPSLLPLPSVNLELFPNRQRARDFFSVQEYESKLGYACSSSDNICVTNSDHLVNMVEQFLASMRAKVESSEATVAGKLAEEGVGIGLVKTDGKHKDSRQRDSNSSIKSRLRKRSSAIPKVENIKIKKRPKTRKKKITSLLLLAQAESDSSTVSMVNTKIKTEVKRDSSTDDDKPLSKRILKKCIKQEPV